MQLLQPALVGKLRPLRGPTRHSRERSHKASLNVPESFTIELSITT